VNATLTIAGRAVASLITTQGVGDLYRIYAIAQRDRVDFNLAYIPNTFNAPHPQEFDTAYMRALSGGLRLGDQGKPSLKQPPCEDGPSSYPGFVRHQGAQAAEPAISSHEDHHRRWRRRWRFLCGAAASSG
jgi:hypothetical protein